MDIVIQDKKNPTSEEVYEVWFSLKNRDFRALKSALHAEGVNLALAEIEKLSVRHQWKERAFADEIRVETEVTTLALAQVMPEMVRRRGATMLALAEMYDDTIIAAAGMIKNDVYKAKLKDHASPDMLAKLLKAAGLMADLRNEMAPLYPPKQDEEESTTSYLTDGAVDPNTLAQQLIALSRKPTLSVLRGEVTDIESEDVLPERLQNIKKIDKLASKSIHE